MFGRFLDRFRQRRDEREPAGPTTIYGFELLSSRPVEIDERRIFEELSAELGEIDRAEHSESFQYFVRQVSVAYEDGQLPAQLVLFREPLRDHNWIGTDALEQSWRLSDADDAVPRCDRDPVATVKPG
jgi:hypothetical protein